MKVAPREGGPARKWRARKVPPRERWPRREKRPMEVTTDQRGCDCRAMELPWDSETASDVDADAACMGNDGRQLMACVGNRENRDIGLWTTRWNAVKRKNRQCYLK